MALPDNYDNALVSLKNTELKSGAKEKKNSIQVICYYNGNSYLETKW